MSSVEDSHPSDLRDVADSGPVRWADLDERVGLFFWGGVFGVGASFAFGIITIVAGIDPLEVQAGLIGAFLGSSPVMLLPLAARAVFGSDSSLARRSSVSFRALTVFFGVLFAGDRLLNLWPRHSGNASMAITLGGLFAAILGAWFLPHFPAAARGWLRHQVPPARKRSEPPS